jgi:hypothetical protein
MKPPQQGPLFEKICDVALTNVAPSLLSATLTGTACADPAASEIIRASSLPQSI